MTIRERCSHARLTADVNQSAMPYSTGDEYLSIAFVGVSTTPLWFYERWTPIARAFDPLIEELGLKTGVRTTQAEKDSQIRFGRLAWGEQSDRKWTHGSPQTKDKSPAWTFMEGEVWCPQWKECGSSRTNPSLFLSFANPFIFGEPRSGQFNQLFHLAMPTALCDQHFERVSPAIATIKQQLEATDCVMRVVPWNLNYDSIQSTLNNHMKYRDCTNDLRFDVTRTDVQWRPYEPGRLTPPS
jgi:hypothetical protein